MAVLGPRLCARALPSCGKRGPLFIAVRGPLTIAASSVAEHRLQTRRLSNCGSRAQLLRGTRDPPRPGLEPASPALAGRFSATAPPGKPKKSIFYFESSTASFHPSSCSVGTLLPLTFRKGKVKMDGVLYPESICHPSKAASPQFSRGMFFPFILCTTLIMELSGLHL